MLETDIIRLSPQKLAAMADFLGIKPDGVHGTLVMRKSLSDPRTGRAFQIKRSTKTTDLRLAVLRASKWWNEHVARVQGDHLASFPGTRHGASLKEVADHYQVAATCALATRKKNLALLKHMVAKMYPEENFDELPASIADGKLVRQWQLEEKKEAEKCLPDAQACEQHKRGANARYRQARSVFSVAMIRAYEDAGLVLPPTVKEFATQGFIPAAKPPPSQQIDPQVVRKIYDSLPALKETNPGTWACLLLMFRGALRNSEAEKARWDWILPSTDGHFRLLLHTQGDFKPKAGGRAVALARDVVEQLQQVRAKGDDHVVPAANDFERHEACNRAVNAFLRLCGVEAIKGKIAYRLRGHAITEVILANGMDAAQQLAGHTTRTTTEIYRGAAVPYAPLTMPAN